MVVGSVHRTEAWAVCALCGGIALPIVGVYVRVCVCVGCVVHFGAQCGLDSLQQWLLLLCWGLCLQTLCGPYLGASGFADSVCVPRSVQLGPWGLAPDVGTQQDF